MRVLIADNNEDRRTKLAKIFSTYCESDSSDNGPEVVALFTKSHEAGRPYTFIVLSHPIPLMETPEVLRRIRSFEKDQGRLSRSTVCVLSSIPNCQKLFTGLLGHDPQTFFHPAQVDVFGLLSIFKESNQKRLEDHLRTSKMMPSIKTRLDFTV